MRNKIVKKEKYNVEICYFERNGDVVLTITDEKDFNNKFQFSGNAETKIINLIERQLNEES